MSSRYQGDKRRRSLIERRRCDFDGLVALRKEIANSQHSAWDGPRKVLIHKTLRFTASA